VLGGRSTLGGSVADNDSNAVISQLFVIDESTVMLGGSVADNESSAVISLIFNIDESTLMLGGCVAGCAVIFSGSMVSLSTCH